MGGIFSSKYGASTKPRRAWLLPLILGMLGLSGLGFLAFARYVGQQQVLNMRDHSRDEVVDYGVSPFGWHNYYLSGGGITLACPGMPTPVKRRPDYSDIREIRRFAIYESGANNVRLQVFSFRRYPEEHMSFDELKSLMKSWGLSGFNSESNVQTSEIIINDAKSLLVETKFQQHGKTYFSDSFVIVRLNKGWIVNISAPYDGESARVQLRQRIRSTIRTGDHLLRRI